MRTQGINRFEYKERMGEYYIHLINTLEAFDKLNKNIPPTRDNLLNSDCKVLGIESLPDIEDICEDKHFKWEEKEERHRKWVDDAEKNGRYNIENVFQITLKTTGASDNLVSWKYSAPSPNEPTSLLALPLQIGQAYLAPLRLLTGPITLMEEKLASARNKL